VTPTDIDARTRLILDAVAEHDDAIARVGWGRVEVDLQGGRIVLRVVESFRSRRLGDWKVRED